MSGEFRTNPSESENSIPHNSFDNYTLPNNSDTQQNILPLVSRPLNERHRAIYGTSESLSSADYIQRRLRGENPAEARQASITSPMSLPDDYSPSFNSSAPEVPPTRPTQSIAGNPQNIRYSSYNPASPYSSATPPPSYYNPPPSTAGDTSTPSSSAPATDGFSSVPKDYAINNPSSAQFTLHNTSIKQPKTPFSPETRQIHSRYVPPQTTSTPPTPTSTSYTPPANTAFSPYNQSASANDITDTSFQRSTYNTFAPYSSSYTPTFSRQQQHSIPPGVLPNDDSSPLQNKFHEDFSVAEFQTFESEKTPPKTGWRKGLYLLTGSKVNPGLSAKERYQETLKKVISKPLHKNYQISVLSMKGGVGKTTTTFAVGSILASLRNDKVIAVDANPDLGTLSHRTNLQTERTVRDLINNNNIRERSDVNTYANIANSGLEVIVGDFGTNSIDGLSLEDYHNVMKKLGPFYRIVLTDCGTGIHHPSVQGSLEAAHVVLIPTVPSIDSARSTLATMNWLEKNGYEQLLKNSIIIINSLRFGSANLDIEQMRDQFLPRVRAVHSIPYDPHIAEGGLIDIKLLNKATVRAYTELAALIVENFQ